MGEAGAADVADAEYELSRAMNELCEYDVVRVESLTSARPDQHVSSRQPAIGDSGTIVFVLAPNEFLVESVAGDGRTVWLCDFSASDLSLVWRPA